MKEKLIKFMYGRYGADQFTKFVSVLIIICLIINIFTNGIYFYAAGILLFAYNCFRMFSKDHSKRYKENQVYLKYADKIKHFFKREKYIINERKTHHIYTCPKCKQKIRIPKGKGRISVSCPKCHTEFIKNS